MGQPYMYMGLFSQNPFIHNGGVYMDNMKLPPHHSTKWIGLLQISNIVNSS